MVVSPLGGAGALLAAPADGPGATTTDLPLPGDDPTRTLTVDLGGDGGDGGAVPLDHGGPHEVTIVRDEKGVPHLYTDDATALWYANGYVQAQDRLWALDLLRHISYGEGASVAGSSLLAMDMDVRRDLYTRAELRQMMAESPPEFIEVIEAFSDGVNRAFVEMTATGELPAEFVALNHPFEPWEPIDTAAVATFLLARFGEGGGAEIGNAKLLAQLEASLGDRDTASLALADLVWAEPDDAYSTIPAEEGHFAADPDGEPLPWSELPAAQQEVTLAAMDSEPFGLDGDPLVPTGQEASAPPAPFDLKWGSHALVVSPELSADGRAMVGGGPQTGYFNPEVLYEVGLHLTEPTADGETLEAEGIGVMGAPGVIIGRTANFAWTVTSGVSDQTDIVALEAIGDRTFIWDGIAQRLDCRTERHVVLTPPAVFDTGTDPREQVNVVDQEVCKAHLPRPDGFGGTVHRTAPIVAVTEGDDGSPEWFFAKQTASRHQEAQSSVKWLSLDLQDDYREFAETFEPGGVAPDSPGFAFTFNFHYAGLLNASDPAGDAPSNQVACYKHVGLQPVRADGLDPRFPTPPGDAWTWQGYLTGDELPNDCNPDQGYYANWNNLPQQGWPSGDTRELWGAIHRVERLDREVREVVDPDGDGELGPDGGDASDVALTLDDVKAIVKDGSTEDSLAGQIVPLLLSPAFAGATPDAAADALAAWAMDDYAWQAGGAVSNDSAETYDHRGHTVYDRLLPALMDAIYGDELGDHARDINFTSSFASDPHAGDHGQHRTEFAILVTALGGTPMRNWCDDVTTNATVESCADRLAAAYAAAGLDGFETVDEIPFTEQHRSPFTSLGTGPAFTMPMTNRATYYHFHVGSDVTESFSALPAGNSGHLSLVDLAVLTATGTPPEHMDDQLQMYVDFEFKHLPWTLAEAEGQAESVETLVVP